MVRFDCDSTNSIPPSTRHLTGIVDMFSTKMQLPSAAVCQVLISCRFCYTLTWELLPVSAAAEPSDHPTSIASQLQILCHPVCCNHPKCSPVRLLCCAACCPVLLFVVPGTFQGLPLCHSATLPMYGSVDLQQLGFYDLVVRQAGLDRLELWVGWPSFQNGQLTDNPVPTVGIRHLH